MRDQIMVFLYLERRINSLSESVKTSPIQTGEYQDDGNYLVNSIRLEWENI